MGLLSAIGTIGGSIVGGPIGGVVGGTIGGLLDESRSSGKAREIDERTIEELRQFLINASNEEMAALREGNEQAAAEIRAAVAEQLAVLDNVVTNVHPERLAALREWFKEAKAPFVPFHTTGVNALTQQASMLGIPGPDGQVTPFDPNIITSRPSYQFVMDEGLRGVDRSASARSGSLSGRAVKESERYAAGLASREFDNEFARLNNLSRTGLDAGRGISTAALATQSQVNRAYSDLFSIYTGIAGVHGAEGEALANFALSNAQGMIDISQNQTNAMLGLYGLDNRSQQNELTSRTNNENRLANAAYGIWQLYGKRGGTTSGGGGGWPTGTAYTPGTNALVGDYSAGFT